MARPDFSELDITVRDWSDISGHHYNVDADQSLNPTDADLDYADLVRVTITYPGGDSDTRWFAGPFENGWDDLLYDIEEWYDNGS